MTETKEENSKINELKKEIGGLLLISFSVLTVVSLTSSGQAGTAGLYISELCSSLFGLGAFLLPVFFGYTGILLICRDMRRPTLRQKIGFVLAVFLILTLLHRELGSTTAIESGLQGYGGGILGALFLVGLRKLFGTAGTQIVLITTAACTFLLITGLRLRSLGLICIRLITGTVKRGGTAVKKGLRSALQKKNKQKTPKKNDPIDTKTPDEKDHSSSNNGEVESDEVDDNGLPERDIVVREQADIELEDIESFDDRDEHYSGNYSLPPLKMLEDEDPDRQSSKSREEINNNIAILEKTLDNFGLKGEVIQVSRGPTITRYELEPAPGVKVSKIVNLSNDLALALAAPSVRIEAPVPGKGVIGIEVPNQNSSFVRLKTILSTRDFINSDSKLTIALGKDIAGKPMVTRLNKMPHLLIAGATGSGKSVYINSLIISILFKSRPEEVKFLLVDPKRVELSDYDGIPHLITPVVTNPKEAAQALKWMVKEMERRYELFAENGVRGIEGYNQLPENDREGEHMPYIVVLIDELSDLMMVAPSAVEDAICRLAQMARAAGIHLVIATQRPSVDVITGIIKANIPSRISFAVSSQTDSRTILDVGGAEKLLGDGDMLYAPVGASKPVRIQGPFISDEELKNVVSFLKKQGAPDYREGIFNENLETSLEEEREKDELYDTAVELVVESGQASISKLQRKLRIGYNRAARIVDQMEEDGVVGGYRGTKPREVLISKGELTELKEEQKPEDNSSEKVQGG